MQQFMLDRDIVRTTLEHHEACWEGKHSVLSLMAELNPSNGTDGWTANDVWQGINDSSLLMWAVRNFLKPTPAIDLLTQVVEPALKIKAIARLRGRQDDFYDVTRAELHWATELEAQMNSYGAGTARLLSVIEAWRVLYRPTDNDMAEFMHTYLRLDAVLVPRMWNDKTERYDPERYDIIVSPNATVQLPLTREQQHERVKQARFKAYTGILLDLEACSGGRCWVMQQLAEGKNAIDMWNECPHGYYMHWLIVSALTRDERKTVGSDTGLNDALRAAVMHTCAMSEEDYNDGITQLADSYCKEASSVDVHLSYFIHAYGNVGRYSDDIAPELADILRPYFVPEVRKTDSGRYELKLHSQRKHTTL